MIMKSIVLVFLAGIISVKTQKITERVEKSNTNEYMSYGWRVTFPEIDGSHPLKFCYGTFVAERVFIADAWCVMRYTLGRDDDEFYIIKSYHDHSNNSRVLTVNLSHIYYHEDLSVDYDFDKLQVAVLITDYPVKSELVTNGFIRLNQNFNDVNTMSCFMPSYDSWNITFTSCETAYIKSDDRQHVYCLSHDLSKFSGSAFICHLKAQPDVKVLVGVPSKFSCPTENCNKTGPKLSVIEHVSGLQKVIDEKINGLC